MENFTELLDNYEKVLNQVKELEKQLRPLKEQQSILKKKIEKDFNPKTKFVKSSLGTWFKFFYKASQRKADFDMLKRFLSVSQYKQAVSQSEYFMVGTATKKELAEIEVNNK